MAGRSTLSESRMAVVLYRDLPRWNGNVEPPFARRVENIFPAMLDTHRIQIEAQLVDLRMGFP